MNVASIRFSFFKFFFFRAGIVFSEQNDFGYSKQACFHTQLCFLVSLETKNLMLTAAVVTFVNQQPVKNIVYKPKTLQSPPASRFVRHPEFLEMKNCFSKKKTLIKSHITPRVEVFETPTERGFDPFFFLDWKSLRTILYFHFLKTLSYTSIFPQTLRVWIYSVDAYEVNSIQHSKKKNVWYQ